MVDLVDKLKLKDLIDVAELQPIIDMAFDALAGATSLIDIEGNVLCASGWQEICTEFHRVHPVARQACIASDVHFTRELSSGQPAVVNRCPHGLIDCASPIVIDDAHVGNVFIGQVLTEPPDVQRFKLQALEYGFDESAYLLALAKVPVISQDQLERTLPFINALSVMVAELGLAHLKNVEREQQLRKAQRIAGFGSWTLENSSRSMALSSQALRLIGMHGRRRPTLETFLASVHPDDRLRVAETLESSIEQRKPGGVEHRVIDADGGQVRHVSEWWEHVESETGVVQRSLGIIRDITDRVRRSEALEQAAEAERTRLARDLHDSVSQTLFAASLMSASLESMWCPEDPQAQALLSQLTDATHDASAEVRSLLLETLPTASDELPVKDSLHQLVTSFRRRSPIPVTLEVEGDWPVPPEVQSTLYRIAREAMNNVARHSGAECARLALLMSGNSVRLEIADNGRGFDLDAVSPGHLGLVIMRERADSIGAKFTASSGAGQGTQLTVEWGEGNGRR